MWIFNAIGYATLALLIVTYPVFRADQRENGSTGVANEIAMPVLYALFFGPMYYSGILAVAFATYF